jgi:hypothetical protein
MVECDEAARVFWARFTTSTYCLHIINSSLFNLTTIDATYAAARLCHLFHELLLVLIFQYLLTRWELADRTYASLAGASRDTRLLATFTQATFTGARLRTQRISPTNISLT